jgi:aminoglycoside phosphotransferase (APT) family kinase protein
VLAHTSVEAPHFYGTVEDSGAWTWMFVEHIAGERYTPHRADHRRAAAKWVADLHVATMESASPQRLPDRGPGHLREWVRRGRDAMATVAGYPAATRDELRTAEALRSTLDALDSDWSEVARAAGQLPRTLVHGDLVRKNLVVRRDRGVVAFDWEKAGWGTPALDLAYGDGGDVSERFAASPCLDTYRSVLSVHGLEVERDVVAQCAAIGTALRCVFGIGWSAVSLNDRWVHYPMAYMAAYAPVLERAMAAAGIGGRDARN